VNEATILRANALHIPLADNSVDLVVTSPPYFALRSYRDGDEHYADQIGSEPTPHDFLVALWAATAEMARVIKPSGSIWVNLGDKYAGSGGHNNGGISKPDKANGTAEHRAARRNAPDRYNQESGGARPKSLMGLPWRYAIGCIDQLHLILRAEVIWEKANGLPESVKDRVRRNHEQWFHFTKEPLYYSSIDEIREPSSPQSGLAGSFARPKPSHDLVPGQAATQHRVDRETNGYNPLGRTPGSVWKIASEPLIIKEATRLAHDLPSHFAAFPQELPRRIILGWSPEGVCTGCGEGRRPVTTKTGERGREPGGGGTYRTMKKPGAKDTNLGAAALTPRVISGYACACTPRTSHRGKQGDWKEGRKENPGTRAGESDTVGALVARRPGGFGTRVPTSDGEWEYHLDGWVPPATRPGIVLDPFAGTGTTVGVARALGRHGIGLDLSFDYARLARWRVFESGHFSKTVDRTNSERQGSLL